MRKLLPLASVAAVGLFLLAWVGVSGYYVGSTLIEFVEQSRNRIKAKSTSAETAPVVPQVPPPQPSMEIPRDNLFPPIFPNSKGVIPTRQIYLKQTAFQEAPPRGSDEVLRLPATKHCRQESYPVDPRFPQQERRQALLFWPASFDANAPLPPGFAPLPAVVWIGPSWDGIGPHTWTEIRGLLDAGVVVYCPSFRGQVGNAGAREALYGELDELVAAIRQVQTLPFVDAKRVSVIGEGSFGGTLTLLASASASPIWTTSPRCFLAMEPLLRVTPQSDLNSPRWSALAVAQPLEAAMRSPIYFLRWMKPATYVWYNGSTPNSRSQAQEVAALRMPILGQLRVWQTELQGDWPTQRRRSFQHLGRLLLQDRGNGHLVLTKELLLAD